MGGSRSPGGFAGGCRSAVRGLARNMRSGRLPHSCGAGVAVLLLVGLLPVAAGAVKELAFADMDPSLSDQVDLRAAPILAHATASVLELHQFLRMLQRVFF
jgi:hypothetical protein